MRTIRSLAVLVAALALLAIGAGSASAAPAINGEFNLTGTPKYLAVGPDGNVWVALQDSNNDVAKVAPDGTVTEYDLAPNITNPTGITSGPDGNLWTTQSTKVGRFSPANPEGTATAFNVADLADPRAIVAAPDGNLWAASQDKLIKVTTAGAATATTINGMGARGMTVGSDGTLWIADFGGNRVVNTTTANPAGATFYATGGNPQEVGAGPNTQILYANPNQEIGRITPGATPQPLNIGATDPFGIAFGGDGAYWIAQFNTHNLGRMTPNGEYSTLGSFSPGAGPRYLTAGPNNTLWVGLETAKKVARVTGVELPAQGTPPGGTPPGGTPGGGKDTVAPVFSSVSMSATAFRVGSAPTAISAAGRRIPTGTTIRYRLSEAATVRLLFERALPGRRRGRACVKPTRALRRARRCTRYLRRGTLTRAGKQGRNSVRFSGRIGRRALAAGSYRVTVSGKDAAGNSAKVKRLRFRILPPPRTRR